MPGNTEQVAFTWPRESVDGFFRREIQMSDRSFYRDPSRVQLQQEASREALKERRVEISWAVLSDEQMSNE